MYPFDGGGGLAQVEVDARYLTGSAFRVSRSAGGFGIRVWGSEFGAYPHDARSVTPFQFS